MFVTIKFFRSMPGDEQETVTRQDLTELFSCKIPKVMRDMIDVFVVIKIPD